MSDGRSTLAERLEPFSRTLADAQLREPRHWPTTRLIGWIATHEPDVPFMAAMNALAVANDRELRRREALAIHAGVLVDGRWPLAFDVGLREHEEKP